jgi:hypothetical protein
MAVSKSSLSTFLVLAIAGCAPAAAPPLAPAPEPGVASASSPEPGQPGPSVSAPPAATPPAPASAATPPAPLPTGGTVRVGDVVAPPSFDPKPTLAAAKPQLLPCYNQARQNNPSLHGKLNLRIHVNETGAVLLVDAEPGGSASDPTLVSCIGEAFKLLVFPKPGGTATLIVPLVFHP